MKDRLAMLANDIRKKQHMLKQKAEQARSSDPLLVLPIKKITPDLSVCAVDGGLLAHRLHGADVIVVRAAGVNFVYRDSALKSHEYHPSKTPQPVIEYMDSLDDHEASVFRSLVRLKHELGCAVTILEKFSPDLLLIDGSLLPVPSDRPAEDSALKQFYEEILFAYEKLFSRCKEKRCVLCGVVKDSRSKKLTKDFGLNYSDSLFCNYLLKAGERTKDMPYYEEKTPNKELALLGEGIKVFYLKAGEHDIPIRVETTHSDIDHAASLVYSLSAISEHFAYPAVLIEADMCAAFDRKDADALESDILSLSGINPLRRNSRPFR